MKKVKYILVFCLPVIFPLLLSGQDVSITADFPSVVRLGQQFSITWTVNAGGGELTTPSFDGFYKLMGPQTSYSSSTQVINGKVSSEISNSYTYYFQATREGKFVIAPAKFTLKNKTYRSDSIRIEVTGSNASASQSTNSGAASVRNSHNENVRATGDDIFVNLSLDRKEVYMGEHIVATVKIYTKVDITGINEIKYPGFEGFLKTDLDTPPLTTLQRENLNGTTYGTGVIQQFLLYPQVSGEIKIDPVQVSVLVQQKTGQSDPFFGDFFASYTTVPKAVLSQALKVKVIPLPGTKPADFSGIVGKVGLTASIDKDSVNVNDAVSYKIAISGSGNLKLANAPEMKLPADIEVYDPKISDDLKNGPNGTTGTKTFEYLLIPRHYGEFSIPSVTYSYFNVSTKQFEKLSTPELHFFARKGTEQNTGTVVYGGVSKEDVKYVGKDIRYIKSKPGLLRRPGNIISSKHSYYSTFAFGLILFLIVLFVRREHIRRNSDLTIVKNRKAGKVAVKRLKVASQCLKDGTIDKFYEEILKSMWGYLSDKLNIPVSDLTRNNAVNALKEKGIDDALIGTLSSILDTCEYARYAPSSSGTEAEKLFEDSSQFISSVENSIG